MNKALSLLLLVGLAGAPVYSAPGVGKGKLMPKVNNLVIATTQLKRIATREVTQFPAKKIKRKKAQKLTLMQIKKLNAAAINLKKAVVLVRYNLAPKRRIKRALGKLVNRTMYLNGNLHKLFKKPRKGVQRHVKVKAKFKKVKKITKRIKKTIRRKGL